jgi:hypothetical protein
VCKIRDNQEPVTGCSGLGTKQMNYCSDPNLECSYTWSTPPLEIQSKVIAYHELSKSWKITINTSKSHIFKKGDLVNNILTLDGKNQVTESVTETTAVFKINQMDKISTSAVTLRTQAGFTSAKSIATIGTISLTPKLLTISPNLGSTKGTTVTVTAPGLGMKTQNVMLVAIINNISTPVCASVTIYEFGKFYCVTK